MTKMLIALCMAAAVTAGGVFDMGSRGNAIGRITGPLLSKAIQLFKR